MTQPGQSQKPCDGELKTTIWSTMWDLQVHRCCRRCLASTSGQHVRGDIAIAPRELEGGWTDASRDQLFRTVLSQLSKFSPSCSDRIVGHVVQTPADLERDLLLTGGHVHHGEHGLDQMFSLRPHSRCARYGTPITGLWLCGSGSHPGGGITCAPAELASNAIR